MKVEFMDSEVSGAGLYISASEFLKARKSETEFTSLRMAVHSFTRLFDVDYRMPENEYDAITDWLDKTNGKVIFSIHDDWRYPYCEVCVANGNSMKAIIYDDETGHHVMRQAKVSQQRIRTAKKKK